MYVWIVFLWTDNKYLNQIQITHEIHKERLSKDVSNINQLLRISKKKRKNSNLDLFERHKIELPAHHLQRSSTVYVCIQYLF